jgi:hypothetical protein
VDCWWQVKNCEMYQTVLSNPSYGIVCSSTSIKDEAGDHKHPRLRKVNVPHRHCTLPGVL